MTTGQSRTLSGRAWPRSRSVSPRAHTPSPSEFWIRVGSDDLRQITSIFAGDGRCTFCILPSRLAAAERARLQRLREAVQAGLALRAALSKLGPDDQGRARLLSRQLSRWI